MQMNSSKPFPWKCGECGKRAVVEAKGPYTEEIVHDGRAYTVKIPDLVAPQCESCGAMIMDDAANQQISEAFRAEVGLLTPEQIRRNRESLGKTQKQLAAMLGVAEATLCRWETGGQIQQRAMDRLLRLCFGIPAVRAALVDEDRLRGFGGSPAPA